MTRQRMVKPEFFDSENLGACSIPARLAFIGLWVMGDDYGNQKAQASRLKLKIFPYDTMTDDEFIGLLCELEETGCIKGYVVEGERYINVPNFPIYQTVRKPSKSSIPEPPKSTVKARRTKVLQGWRNGDVPVSEDGGSTPPVRYQYATSDPKERKKEGSEGVLTHTFAKERGASVGADALGAPPAAPRCPLCETSVTFDARSGMWRCSNCGDVFETPGYGEVAK